MTVWKRKTGDVKDTIVVDLYGVDDLSTVSAVEGHITKGATAVNVTGTVTTATATATDPCAVTLQLGQTAGQAWLPTATAGVWTLETEITFADGTVRTWPGGGFDQIVVTAQGDPAP